MKQNGKAAHEGWVMGQLLPGTMRAQSCREFWEAVEHAAGSPTGRKRELGYLSRTDISILLLSPSASLFFFNYCISQLYNLYLVLFYNSDFLTDIFYVSTCFKRIYKFLSKHFYGGCFKNPCQIIPTFESSCY